MTWFGIVLIAYWVLNAAIAILMVNRSITYTPVAVLTLCSIYALLIWGAVTVGTLQ